MNPIHALLFPLLCRLILLGAVGFLFSSCANNEEEAIAKGEFIYRVHEEHLLTIPAPQAQVPTPFPWEIGQVGNHPKITKEFFRCKGSGLNPVHMAQEGGENVQYYDCGGAEKHSLPLRNQKEFIYPILIDLLNYIQSKTQKRVVITSGHRCPEHNTYVDASPSNRYSKHMVGAEVSFYVQGMEDKPEAIVNKIQEYFKDTPKYKGEKEFVEFKRYEKSDSNVATQPWLNKEVFVKLFKKKEGRNFDNRHPYPYISIQVRYDFDTGEKVIYSWDKANRNYLRK